MPLLPPIIIADSTGQQWYVGCDDGATPVQVPLAVPVSDEAVVPYVYLNSVTDGSSWQITVVAAPSINAGDLQATNVYQNPDYPTQLLVTAPNGTVYGIQIATVGPPVLGSTANGVIQTILPTDLSLVNCTTPMSALAKNVLNRLEDPTGIFWSEQFEVMTALAEAENLLMLLVGRPTQTVNVPFNLTPNQVWQQNPAGIFLITNIWGPQSQLRKVDLYDMDFNQSSWLSDWENDSSNSGPVRWGNLGFNQFFVHPAPAAPQTVLLDAIQYPVPVNGFPYSGSTNIPFPEEMFVALEDYACVYNRIKETGVELQEAMPLYRSFLTLAKRLSEIEDRRDSMVFSPSFGAPAGANSLVKR